MCGIAGIVGCQAAEYREAVEGMMTAMVHRGPDGEGVYISKSGRCVLGHRRLAILDLTDHAGQPMVDATGEHALSYNGECYNYADLRSELGREGASFRSSGDSEVIFRTLIHRGPECLPDLNGMFGLAFWSEGRQSLLLARDRFGQKPLYFTFRDRMLIFASEVRALLASKLVAPTADVKSVFNFLACGSVPGPGTIVDNVGLLPGAHYLVVKVDAQRGAAEGTPQPYWSPPRDKIEVRPEDLRSAFAGSVGRHMISDVPVGVFLSGGMDSSAVAAGAMREHDGEVTTLCVVYPEQSTECEGPHAKRIADAIGSRHVEVPVTGETILQLVRGALDNMDQPTVDGINTYVVAYAARQAGFKAALSGLGGDELFGGYRQVFTDPVRFLTLRRRLRTVGCRIAAGVLGWIGDSRRATKIADALIAPDGLLPAYLVRRRLFTSRQIQGLFPTYGLNGWFQGIPREQFEFLSSLIADREPADALGLLNMVQYMGQQLLRDADVMGMAHSLEIRAPFLDTRFASKALRLPSSARVPSGILKHRFAEAVSDWLPSETISRPKQGFSMPFEHWMSNELREDVWSGVEELRRFIPSCDINSARRIVSGFFRRPHRVGWSRPWALFVLGRYLKNIGLTCSGEHRRSGEWGSKRPTAHGSVS